MRLIKLVTLFAIIYFLAGAVTLRFGLPYLLFPSIQKTGKTSESMQLSAASSQMEMLARVYGEKNRPCLFFFTGQHGGALRYEHELGLGALKEELTTVILSYPSQGGAKGNVSDIKALAKMTTSFIADTGRQLHCTKAVYYGRSLGAIVATYSASQIQPDGLILESSPVSLSQSVKHVLSNKWYLFALQLLPIDALIPNDFKVEALLKKADIENAIIFQGDNDSVTPLADIELVAQRTGIDLIIVNGGTHSSTITKAKPQIFKQLNEWLY
ncbi:hypothetical protein C1E23_18370 [Pseudoalteromonas phenolica]|uniref:Alpha/beta hydrolase n=2 Tax=Pseudoalteromonas phenolica TaxID=161398 RepID=A0A4Q7IIN4_9GAMM|nr:hypothetical protein C1E23_18370 [Pseudoalteromonas phenolica]